MNTSSFSWWKDYLELTKPKVVALLMITAWVGMYLASPELPSLSRVFIASIGMGFAMSGSAVVNHVVDYRIDIQMARTTNRPIAQSRIKPLHALFFAAALSVSGVAILYFFINPLTAILTFLGSLCYALVYTLFLKRATPQNIVIGGFAGALPPLLGWTAITGNLDPHAWLLVLIIFVWTPPHFWALAIHRVEDYAKAGIPMLPVTHGIEFTKIQIILYTVMLLLATALPFLTGMSGWFYAIVTSILNIIFLYFALKLKFSPTTKTPMQFFGYSIVYLFALFIALLIDYRLFNYVRF
jgi:protoheme IX farnesyltransferase